MRRLLVIAFALLPLFWARPLGAATNAGAGGSDGGGLHANVSEEPTDGGIGSGPHGDTGESGGGGVVSPEWQAYFDCVEAATTSCMSPPMGVGDPALPAAVPEALAEMALDSATIALPQPHTSPDGVPQMTGLMTWFWIDPTAWVPISARAELPGVWAEVTATPTSATWTPGDGGAAVTCDGPGRAHPGTSGATTDCGHTYVDIGSYTLTVDVTYQVAWDSSTGAGGELDPIVVSGEVPIRVEQRQAVID